MGLLGKGLLKLSASAQPPETKEKGLAHSFDLFMVRSNIMHFCFPLGVVPTVNSPFFQVGKIRLHDLPKIK